MSASGGCGNDRFSGPKGGVLCRPMTGSLPHAGRLLTVQQVFKSLPERYLGAEPGFDATYHLRLCDLGQVWEIRLTEKRATVLRGVTRTRPDVTISTDSETWLSLREGAISGIEAFSQRLLYARGDLDLAVGFEGRFARPGGRPPLLRLHDVTLPGRRVRTLTMGDGEQDVLLLHGLGATKSSFFETAATLAPSYRVHALDFPGFGWSSKPPYAPYSARWFAETVVQVMDQLGIEQAHLVGNSMGGRVAIEVGLRRPERVRALGLLCPAVAFIKRAWHPLVRVARPEFGLLPHRYPRRAVASQLMSLFFDRDAIDPLLGDLVVDEFQRIYGSAGARFAFLCAARNIYLDAPWGKNGFYARLADLEAPALFIWGSHDKLIPAAFKRHVAEWLPTAEQVVIDRCGHVPQVEHPETTNALLQDFFERIDAKGRRFVPRRARLAA
jgi:pimeloyl-ACP methyl ester carboxylesterase